MRPSGLEGFRQRDHRFPMLNAAGLSCSFLAVLFAWSPFAIQLLAASGLIWRGQTR